MSGQVEAEQRGPALARRRAAVLVAFGGSPDHTASLAWASAEAAARHAVLRIVTLSAGPASGPFVDAHLADRAGVDARVADLLIVAAEAHDTAVSLLELLPRSGQRRLACPVILLRGPRLQPIRRIVVGVTGSRFAAAALDWAVDEAAIHHADLIVVHAWQRQPGEGQLLWRESLDRAEADRVVDLAVRACITRSDGAVHGVVQEGDAGPVLAMASTDADLLVVGSRAQSGFSAMRFGPVTTSVVDSADCPVAIVDPHVGPG